MEPLGRGLHAKAAAEGLQAARRERAAIGQANVAGGADVGNGGKAPFVFRVTLVVGAGLGGHAREGVGIDVRGVGRHVRDAAAGEARGNAFGIKAQVAEGEKAAVALAEGGPPAAGELGESQVLKVAHDGAGEEALEELGLLGRAAAGLEGVAAHVLAAPGAALVGQHEAVMLDGLGHPAVGSGAKQARALATGAALQKHEQGQVAALVLGRADRAVEEVDALAVLQAVGCDLSGLGAAPVERDLDGVVLHVEAGQVVARELGHGFPSFVLAGDIMRRAPYLVGLAWLARLCACA